MKTKKQHLTNQEFETTVLNINPEEIKTKLRKLGAKEYPEVLMRRWVYDLHPTNPEWLRLRDNGDKITLTYKLRGNSKIGSTTEIEVEVSNFEKTALILSKIHAFISRYQENKRQIFILEGVEFSIDTWPKIPPYLEVEATSEEDVHKGLEILGLSGKDSGDMDVKDIFFQHDIDINSFKVFKF